MGFVDRWSKSINWDALKRVCLHHTIVCDGYCLFIYDCLFFSEALVEFIEAVTSCNVTIEELITIGKRIANIRQSFNIREGLSPLNFKVPERCLGRPPIKYSPLADINIDKETEDSMMRSFLTVMD